MTFTDPPIAPGIELLTSLAAAWTALERRLTGRLGALCGISLVEYTMLRTLAGSANGRASRVEIARTVGLTPSAITRALRPLEQRKVVATVRNERDARLALATLTPEGADLVAHATEVVAEEMAAVLGRSPRAARRLDDLAALLDELARA